jgi:hypothetical protein
MNTSIRSIAALAMLAGALNVACAAPLISVAAWRSTTPGAGSYLVGTDQLAYSHFNSGTPWYLQFDTWTFDGSELLLGDWGPDGPVIASVDVDYRMDGRSSNILWTVDPLNREYTNIRIEAGPFEDVMVTVRLDYLFSNTMGGDDYGWMRATLTDQHSDGAQMTGALSNAAGSQVSLTGKRKSKP